MTGIYVLMGLDDVFGLHIIWILIIAIFYLIVLFRIIGPLVFVNGIGIIICAFSTIVTALLISHYGWKLIYIPLVIILLLFLVNTIKRTAGRFSFTGIPPRVQNSQAASSPASQPQQQPGRLYHGTDLKSALDIFTTGLWLVGKATPRAVWMTDQFKVASHYSGKNGGIVIVKVSPDIRLTKHSSNVYILKVPYAVPNQEYHRIEGLIPVGILDAKGDKIM